MNSIDLSPLYRNSIGFDRFASLLDSALSSDTSATGYPPYNIEVLDDNRYAITLAVAGFKQNELDIKVEKNLLTVRGSNPPGTERKYLYHGIADRAFERKFNLADYIEVTDAELVNGLLTISLVKEVPDVMKPKTITMNRTNRVLEHNGDENAVENNV
ncbi:Hsp20 family protein [Photobacterium sp. J15]|uniref:Hsp20 family protein n=1 Tax=Photobacterium sp. J15 TaxID=265901 RepID=UPI0007E3163C|nr:Hsp20 family protein [Photobacterium sp. J15]